MRSLALLITGFCCLAAGYDTEKGNHAEQTAVSKQVNTDTEKTTAKRPAKPDAPGNDLGKVRWQYVVERIDHLVERIDHLEKETTAIRKELSGVEKDVSDLRKELSEAHERVRQLEERIVTLQELLDDFIQKSATAKEAAARLSDAKAALQTAESDDTRASQSKESARSSLLEAVSKA